jgi:hypothetical protein
MAVGDWKRVDDAECDPSHIEEAVDTVLKIEVRVDDAEDLQSVLTMVARDARTIDRRGESGVYDAQWCGGAARISIARLA